MSQELGISLELIEIAGTGEDGGDGRMGERKLQCRRD